MVSSASEDETRPIKKSGMPDIKDSLVGRANLLIACAGSKRAAGSKQQPKQKASRSKKRQESMLPGISGDDDDILHQVVKPVAFIDPETKFPIDSSLDDLSSLSSPGRRRPSPQLKVFRNPMEEYPTPPTKSIPKVSLKHALNADRTCPGDYKELGLDQEIEPLVFTDPFADGMFDNVVDVLGFFLWPVVC